MGDNNSMYSNSIMVPTIVLHSFGTCNSCQYLSPKNNRENNTNNQLGVNNTVSGSRNHTNADQY